MRYLGCICFFLSFLIVANASDSIPPRCIHSSDWKIVTVGTALSVSAWLVEQSRSIPSHEDLRIRQNKYPIPNWDFHRKELNQRWDLYSDIGAYGSLLLPCSVMLNNSIRNKGIPFRQGVRYVETTWLTISSVFLIKYSAFRPRPFTYSDSFHQDYILKKRDLASYISGHTAMTASNCMFFYLNTKNHIEKDWLRNVTLTSSLLLPAFVGYARMEAGQHFLTDVMSGYLVGVASAYLVHKVQESSHMNFQIGPGMVGISMHF